MLRDWQKYGEPLGKGGRSIVWHVVHKQKKGSHGVMKQLARVRERDWQSDPIECAKLHKEASCIKRAAGEGVPVLLDANTESYANPKERLFYVMDFAGALALDQFAAASSPFVDDAVSIVLKLIDIVERLHNIHPQIIHRDIKPQNIIARGMFDLVLIDFGSCYSDDDLPKIPFINDKPGVVGNRTLQMRGTSESQILDVAQCCSVLFYLLTRRRPGDLTETGREYPQRDPNIRWGPAEISDADKALFIELFERAFAPEERDRFDSCKSLRIELLNIMTRLSSKGPRRIVEESSIRDFASTVSDSAAITHGIVQQQLIDVFAQLGQIASPGEDLSFSEILDRASGFPSEEDGAPLVDPQKVTDIKDFLRKSQSAAEEFVALRSALLFYPTITNYLKARLAAHNQAIENKSGQAAAVQLQEVTELLRNELKLEKMSPEHISAYQLYLDGINGALDGELSTVKAILYRDVWKFGVCVFETRGTYSFHRLFRIPKGNNGFLLMKTDHKELGDWWGNYKDARERPLGKWSELFVANPLFDHRNTGFLNHPAASGRSFVYDRFKDVAKAQSFPLHGQLLCAEQLFEFVDKFGLALGLQPSNTIDLADLYHRCTNRFVPWFAVAIWTLANGPFSVDEVALRQVINSVATLQIVWNGQKPTDPNFTRLERVLRSFTPLELAVSSCETLTGLGLSKIERPYLDLRNVWDLKSIDRALMQERVSIVLKQSKTEYARFLSGNGFTSLISTHRLNDKISRLFYINIKDLLDPSGSDTVPYCYVANADGIFEPVEIQFGDALPQRGMQVSVKGRRFELTCATVPSNLQLLSFNPIRELVYSWLYKDAQQYDPGFVDHGWRPALNPVVAIDARYRS
ncbi:MAG TPA: hypothetical protein V6C81_27815 [Planktothrix sp.]|jgi:serine/threonine protein kinase